eukprot:1997539-Amphidinium_carterae.1
MVDEEDGFVLRRWLLGEWVGSPAKTDFSLMLVRLCFTLGRWHSTSSWVSLADGQSTLSIKDEEIPVRVVNEDGIGSSNLGHPISSESHLRQRRQREHVSEVSNAEVKELGSSHEVVKDDQPISGICGDVLDEHVAMRDLRSKIEEVRTTASIEEGQQDGADMYDCRSRRSEVIPILIVSALVIDIWDIVVLEINDAWPAQRS